MVDFMRLLDSKIKSEQKSEFLFNFNKIVYLCFKYGNEKIHIHNI